MTHEDDDAIPFAMPALPAPVAERQGNFIVVPVGFDLGPNCIKCNEPGNGRPFTRTLTWHPRWLNAIFLIPGILLVALLQKQGKITYCLCPAHRQRRTRMLQITWSLGFAAAAVLGLTIYHNVTTTSTDTTNESIAAFALFILLVLAAVVTHFLARSLKAARIAEGHMLLKGAGPAFLNTLPPASHDPF